MIIFQTRSMLNTLRVSTNLYTSFYFCQKKFSNCIENQDLKAHAGNSDYKQRVTCRKTQFNPNLHM